MRSWFPPLAFAFGLYTGPILVNSGGREDEVFDLLVLLAGGCVEVCGRPPLELSIPVGASLSWLPSGSFPVKELINYFN